MSLEITKSESETIQSVISVCIERMRRCFGQTYVKVVSDVRRLEPTEWHPIGAIGVDVILRIGDNDPSNHTKPIKYFLTYTEAEDIALCSEDYAMLIANQLVYSILQSEYERLKSLLPKTENPGEI